MLYIVSFGPFDGSEENGSTTVATRLVKELRANGAQVEHVVLDTAWASLTDLAEKLDGAMAVLGLGEGFDFYVTVEQFCFRRAGKIADIHGKKPSGTDSWPGSQEDEVLEGDLLWDDRWVPAAALDALELSCHQSVIEGTFTGFFLCNALMYHVLALDYSGGFCHLPPQAAWMKRTGRSADDYAEAFGAIVLAVIIGNELLPRE